MPPGKYYRRGHWVSRPRSKSAQVSGWTVLAVLAALVWFATLGSGTDENTPQKPSQVSKTVPPAQAPAAEQPAKPSDEPPPPEPTEAP